MPRRPLAEILARGTRIIDTRITVKSWEQPEGMVTGSVFRLAEPRAEEQALHFAFLPAPCFCMQGCHCTVTRVCDTGCCHYEDDQAPVPGCMTQEAAWRSLGLIVVEEGWQGSWVSTWLSQRGSAKEVA